MRQFISRLEPELPGLEGEYREEFLRPDRDQVVFGILLWQLPYLAFAITDFAMTGTRPSTLLVLSLRIGYILACLIICLHLKQSVHTPAAFDRAVLFWVLISAFFGLLINRFQPADYASGVLLGLVGVFCYYLFIPNPLLLRVLPPLIYSIYNSAMVLITDVQGSIIIQQSVVIAFLLTNLVGIFFSLRMYRSRRKAFLIKLEEAKIRAELVRLASTDPLTGVLNRRRLLELAGDTFYHFRRYHRPFSLLLMDLDGFKRVNDTLGHLEGDTVLIRFTQALESMRRETDVLGRMGGDEFCLVLPETLPVDAAIVATRILMRTGEIIASDGVNTVAISVSIGISQVREEDVTLDALFARADAALYRAKNGGRNRLVIL